MNCKKCGGLMVDDRDRENPFGARCANCGYRGEAKMEKKECCKNRWCEDPKAGDSVFCVRHRDQKRAANEKAAAKRKGLAPAQPAAGGGAHSYAG